MNRAALLFLCLLPIPTASCADRESSAAVGLGTGGAGAAFFSSGASIPSIGVWGGNGFRNRSFGGVFFGFPLTSYEADEYMPPVPPAPAAPAPGAASPTAD
ncbi:MAG: hypothetical protein LBP38_00245 [Desulfovibrio sp.]|jgi:hypothetical protein|nr:hypothetical protein [Desulfovibrio sp.]